MAPPSTFSLSGAEQRAGGVVRVHFAQHPLAVNPQGVNDALNPSRYSFTGPGVAQAIQVQSVGQDPRAFDVYLAAKLPAGTWVVAVQGVQRPQGNVLVSPQSWTFTAVATPTYEAVAPGMGNYSAQDLLRQHFNPVLKGPTWTAFLAALGAGDQPNFTNAQLAFDQLFTSTASGVWLDRRAADKKIYRPQGLGISDQGFRNYAIKVATGQVTELALLDLLEVFYGPDAVRAYMDSTVGPWNLQALDDLRLVIDETLQVVVVFQSTDFTNASAATAQEVAAAITRALRLYGSKGWAVPYLDPTTRLSLVRIYSGSQGLASKVRCSGGRAQRLLAFPQQLATTPGAMPTWTLAYTPLTQTLRLTPDSNFDVSKVRIGDYMMLYGTNFNAGNRGTFQVTNTFWDQFGGTLVQWFEVVNPQGFSQAGILQAALQDLLVFRPVVQTPLSFGRLATVSSLNDRLDAVLPATSGTVTRVPLQAGYLQVPTQKTVTSVERSRLWGTCQMVVPSHGMQVGSRFLLDGVMPRMTPPATTAGNGTTTTDYGPLTLSSQLVAVDQGNVYHSMVALLDGTAVVGYGSKVVAGVRSLNNTGSNKAYVYANSVTTSRGVQINQYTYGFTAAPSPEALDNVALALVNDGSAAGVVYKTGGTGGVTAVNTVSKFALGAWTSGTAMANARASHGASTLVVAGIPAVLVAGGINSTLATALSSVELLNTSTNTWTSKASLLDARFEHHQLLLQDGRVLVTGGRALLGTYYWTDGLSLGTLIPTSEVYDITHDQWTRAQMGVGRVQHQTVQAANGLVTAIGGWSYNLTNTDRVLSAPTTSCEIWNPTTNQWSMGPAMPRARYGFAAVLVPSLNRVYCIGGTSSLAIDYLDLTTMRWHVSTAQLASERHGCRGVLLTGGTILVTGGTDGTGNTNGQHQLVVIGDESFVSRGLSGEHRVDAVVDANTVQFSTPDWLEYTYSNAATLQCTLMAAPPRAPGVPGPYCFDPRSGVAITATSTTTTAALTKGQQYTGIQVVSASAFPDSPGWLVLGFGTKGQVGPVRYLRRGGTTQLTLDPSYQFPFDVPVGADVTLLLQKGPLSPTNALQLGALYLTGSAAGRVAAQGAILDAIALGVHAKVQVVYPGDRGLAGEGLPSAGQYRLSSKVLVWGGDQLDLEVVAARAAELEP